jgi:hypothetical protein
MKNNHQTSSLFDVESEQRDFEDLEFMDDQQTLQIYGRQNFGAGDFFH